MAVAGRGGIQRIAGFSLPKFEKSYLLRKDVTSPQEGDLTLELHRGISKEIFSA